MNIKNTNKNNKSKCPYCGYEWENRTANPKACPLCKRYLIEKPIEKTKILATAVLFLFGLSLMSTFVLADQSGTVTIAVNVSEAASITVSPNYLEFIAVKPGIFPIPGSKQIDVVNTGSLNFTSLTANVNSFSTETSNPYDTSGNPSVYAAGSFVVVYNSSNSDPNRFENRIEWNHTRGTIANMIKTANAVSWGWFYNHSRSYLWDLVPSTSSPGVCNGSDTTLTVKQTLDSASANRDMSVSTDTGSNVANNTEWATFTFAATSPLADYCVATYHDCTKLMVYQYYPGSAAAVGSTTLPTCGAARYLVQSTSAAASEFPAGDTETFNVTVYVPKGIPAGNVTQSTMTVTAIS